MKNSVNTVAAVSSRAAYSAVMLAYGMHISAKLMRTCGGVRRDVSRMVRVVGESLVCESLTACSYRPCTSCCTHQAHRCFVEGRSEHNRSQRRAKASRSNAGFIIARQWTISRICWNRGSG